MAGATVCMNGPTVGKRDIRPPIDAYKPSLWGDVFSSFSPDDKVQEMYAEAIEGFEKEVKMMLMAATSIKLIILIDTLERLGLAFHFEKEIEEKLKEIYEVHDQDEDNNLFATALQFRLLRQHQYHVSSNVFGKFMDQNEKFKESLSYDVEGLLSLYEAANVAIHGEDILEDAVVFAIHHLTRLVQQLESPIQDKVKQALQCPLHKSVPIIRVRNYISIYEKDDSRHEPLLKFAKLNFNFLQNLYKKELGELSRWWKKLDLRSKLPYVKDRLVESFVWGVAFHYEPEYAYVRKAVAVSIQIITVTDDTYDNYATLNEAQLFTDTLERWNIDEIDPLPDYMKSVYHFLMGIYEEYERDAPDKEKTFAIPYFKNAVIQLCRAYNTEQIWARERHIPSFQEYYAISLVTSCIYIKFTALIPGIKSVTKETVDWLLSEPKIVTSTAEMGRHLDDSSSHERESKGGAILTAVDCYMKYFGLSKQQTVTKLKKLAKEKWKDLNTEWVAKASVPEDMAELLFGYARVCQLTYGSGDGYTNPEKILAPYISTLFLEPLII